MHMKPILKMVIIVAITGLVTSACKPEATETPPPTASYQARTASFDVVENDVRMRLSEDEEYSPAATGQTLPVGGQARTGDESSAQLDLMPDGAILRLGPGTEFTLTELAEGDDDFFARLQMEAGKLWIILTGGELEVETASGTASVRGSLLGIYFFPDIPLLTATC
ncbi:MAG: FecR domain-containing protein, partial [Chloroflexi bacterium]|nr:FecR domain-containing protein [Chloroflexota bacterium]